MLRHSFHRIKSSLHFDIPNAGCFRLVRQALFRQDGVLHGARFVVMRVLRCRAVGVVNAGSVRIFLAQRRTAVFGLVGFPSAGCREQAGQGKAEQGG